MRLPPLRPALAAAGIALLGACVPDSDALLPVHADPAGAAFSAAPDAAPLPTGRFMILGKAGRLPASLEVEVAAAGGRLTSVIPEIGVAFAEPLAEGFAAGAAGIQGVESVVPDFVIEYAAPRAESRPVTPLEAFEAATSGGASVASALADGETFYSLQWAPAAVQAPEAWAAGYTGRGVRVAIVDGAIYHQHLDLAPNLDVAASRSFVPGFAYNQDGGTFWHGTHVAGIVAAAANGLGTIGIAPDAELIGVKVLHNGSGAFEWILNGIVYAARPLAEGGAGAQVINLSLGATFDYRNNWANRAFRDAFRELQKAYDRGTRYAYQQGATVIAAAGNDANDFDQAKHLFRFPSENQHVISVAATGPHGWALGATDFHRPAYYTDHGKSLVGLAAPGGTLGLFVVDGYDGICTVSGPFVTVTRFCEVFDQVLSTVRGNTVASYNWSQGTSMAAPVVSGIAALVIERSGGTASPAQVRTALQRAALDLGEPGNDAFYGHGWVNALRAVQ